MKKRSLFLALPLVAALALSACGGGGSGRPSVDELEKVMTEQLGSLEGVDLPEGTLECAAKAFVDSDISDELLRKLVDTPDFTPTAEETAELTPVNEAIATECFDLG